MLRPVSYTHLDVYKRQLEESDEDKILEFAQAIVSGEVST